MPTLDMPLVVDADGNINVHGQEGLLIALSGGDDDDISMTDLTFATSSGLQVSPEANPNDATGRLLKLSPEQIRELPPVGTRFALIDNQGDEPFVRWGGIIRRWGW